MTGRRTPTWPVWVLAAPAFVAVWSGWVGLGRLTGFGVIHPLPGTPLAGWELDTSITLPIGVEVYGAYALGVWLSGRGGPRATRFARTSAIASLLVGAAGQVAYHLLAAPKSGAPWWITMVVSVLPVAVLGMGASLAHLVRAEAAPTIVVTEGMAGVLGDDSTVTDPLIPALAASARARIRACTEESPASADTDVETRTDACSEARTQALTQPLTEAPSASADTDVETRTDALTEARTQPLTKAPSASAGVDVETRTDARTQARTQTPVTARGRPVSDARTRVLRLHARHPEMSAQALAERVGRSPSTVRRYLADAVPVQASDACTDGAVVVPADAQDLVTV